MKKLLPLLLLLPIACTAETSTEPAKPAAPAAAPAADAIAAVHRVECGCALAEVGHCGNYIEVEGKFVEIAGDLGLGKMEYCGKTGLEAEAEGALVGGKFVATSLTLVD